MKIVVAGGTGFIGKTFVRKALWRGDSVVVLSRRPDKSRFDDAGVTVAMWDSKNLGDWVRHVDGADVVLNLTGELIAGKRWSSSQKELIVSSRIESTRALVLAVGRASRKPRVFINASGVGYYGIHPSGISTEASPAGDDFVARLCARWEEEAMRAEGSGVRVVIPRFGIVLASDGGALQRMMVPFRFFVGGYLGKGTQWLPWMHRDDAVQALMHLVTTRDISGPVNFVAPQAVTMREFCRELGRAMGRPSWTYIPPFALRILLGELADVLLGGQQAPPEKLIESGYTFAYPNLGEALTSLNLR